jgi:carboxyl-terminal processing protease
LNKKFFLVVFSGLLVLFLSIGALLARSGIKDSSYNYLTIFSNVIHLVDGNYVEKVDFNKMMDSALYGMVEGLDGDSFYLANADLDEYKKELAEDKSRSGVGLAISKRYGMVTVMAVEKGSSAAENKIKPGDYIRSINDQYVQNMPLFKIYYLLKGNAGTTVKVSLYESALEKPQDFTLTRRAVTKPYVQAYVAQPKIGYVGIHHLLPGVETEIQAKLDSFGQQGVKDLILDLRNCTEEDQDLAVKVASQFVGSAPIVQITDRTGKTQSVNGTGKAQFQGNLIVLQDFTTAGGAEIIAGAIQDAGAGKVFGVRSYGRGGIQKLIPAGQDYVVLTTQKYLTPKGKMILTNGIDPTIPYKEDVKKAEESDDTDRMLNKAIDLLRYPDQKAAA